MAITILGFGPGRSRLIGNSRRKDRDDLLCEDPGKLVITRERKVHMFVEEFPAWNALGRSFRECLCRVHDNHLSLWVNRRSLRKDLVDARVCPHSECIMIARLFKSLLRSFHGRQSHLTSADPKLELREFRIDECGV